MAADGLGTQGARESTTIILTIFLDIVGQLIGSIFAGKTSLALKRSCNFSHEKSNVLTDQQNMFYYIVEARDFGPTRWS